MCAAFSPFVGNISSFDHQQQDWSTFKSRLEQFFLANGINEESDKSGVKRRAILLSALTDDSFKLASNLVLPNTLDKVSFQNIIDVLDAHFIPKRCGFAERSKFYAASQQQGESYAQWAVRLRGLAAHCNFKHLEDALLDKFVMGMAAGPEREKIFTLDIKELTLSAAVDQAESVRCARAAAAASAPAGTSGGGDVLFKIEGVSKSQPDTDRVKCAVCGRKNHKTSECRFARYKCKKCNSKGHLRKMCNKVNYVGEDNVSEGDDGEYLYNIRCRNGTPMSETVLIKDKLMKFEIDSGSSVTAISDVTYNSCFSDVPLRQTNKNLLSYSGNQLKCLGCVSLPITYENKTINFEVFIIKNGGPPILGRDFISAFELQLSSIKYCELSSLGDNELQQLIHTYSDLFSDRLGCFNKYKIKLHLKEDAKPRFIKARPVPFALREKLDKEIDRLVESEIIEPVKFSEYASPIVPVLKSDGSVRLCADYSQTLNKQLLIEKYPLPTVQELFTKLHGGVQFSKLDMKSAYNQCIIEDDKNVTCINTHKGLFKYKRLVFGLSSAPAIFQKVMESILGHEGVLTFLDDVLITGKDRQEHMERLRRVLQSFKDAGLTLRYDKCEFFKDEVSYLGYIIDKNGIRKSPDKVKAIKEAPTPKNVNQLQSFLGLVNYYRNFVPNASSVLAPLYDLLKKDKKWSWLKEHDTAFCAIKNELSSEKTLAHFNVNAHIILTVDASNFGLGSILSQIGEDGLERPVAYASRTLNSAEKKYSQIQKEATAIIFGIRRFHQFLYARSEPFTLRTDHKPLVAIFGPNHGVPEVSANRLQRYAIFLSAYNYKIEYVRSAHNSADFLSRAPLEPGCARDDSKSSLGLGATQQETTAYVNFVIDGSLPVTHKILSIETGRDTVLRKVVTYVQEGWPKKVSDQSLKPYYLCRLQLSFENGVLLRGHKVVLPEVLRSKILDELHTSHLGIVKTKALARSKFWFPKVDEAIDKMIGECSICVCLRPAPPRSPIVSWPYPKQAFDRIHLDFLGPIDNRMFLVIVDAYSKWVECYDMKNNVTSSNLVNKLCDFMSHYGIPSTLVSDNGTAMTSDCFKNFCKLNGIQHLTSPPYHPASNGQAESFVKVVKKGIKCALLQGRNAESINNRLLRYLFDYRNSVHTTTGQSPASLVFNRELKSRLDLIFPPSPPPTNNLTNTVYEKQCLQNKYRGGTLRKDFIAGDDVMYKKHLNNNKFIWKRGTIVEKLGKIIYLVRDSVDKNLVKKHKNQIFKYKGQSLNEHYDFSLDNDNTQFSFREGEELVGHFNSPSTEPGASASALHQEAPTDDVEFTTPHQSPERPRSPDEETREPVPSRTRLGLRDIPRVDYRKLF